LAELRRSGYENLIASGVVLTGGSSKMEGVVELAEEVFHMPVRLGEPQHVTGLIDVVRNPIHATGVGLLIYGHLSGQSNELNNFSRNEGPTMFGRVKDWIKSNF
jgi:cell division protein FtsA